MRLVELAVSAAFVAGCIAGFRALWARSQPKPRDEWAPFHDFDGARRRVYVRRGDRLEPVGDVAPSDPAYEDTFLALMSQARERAATLNSER